MQRVLDEILARDAEVENPWFERFFEWVVGLFSMPERSMGSAAAWWSQLQLAVIALALLGLLFLIMRYVITLLVERYGVARDGTENVVPVHERVAALRLAALQARRDGDWQVSLQKQFFALVLGLGQRGDLEFRDAWTNRELLALGSPTHSVQAVLKPLLEELEPKEFGRASVESHDLDRLEALAVDYFGALEVQLP